MRQVFRDLSPSPGALPIQPITMAISPDGAHVYVFGSRSVAALSREAQSGLLTQVAGGGMRECGPIVISPDGAYLYRGCGIDQIELFERDRSTGAIALADVLIFDAGGADSDSLVVSPDGNFVYVAGSATLAAFARAAGTGRLTIIEIRRVGNAAFLGRSSRQ